MKKACFSRLILNLIVLIIFFLIPDKLYTQNDSIIFKNKDFIIGEIKNMEKGVLQIETEYSDADFTVKWSEIDYIKTETSFLITLSDGRRFNGTIESGNNNEVIIYTGESTQTEIQDDIVNLISIDNGFWSKLYASIDLGLSMTKANNYQQYSSNSKIGYMADRWATDAYYNLLRTKQDSVNETKRIDYGISYKQYLVNGWYIPAELTFLTNNEQLIDLRIVGQLGMGRFLIQTNHAYWNANIGGSYVNEIYSNQAKVNIAEDPDKISYEAYISSEVNLFDIGDFSLITNIKLSPSLTEKRRWRVDYNFTAAYDLPYDFYIKGSFSLNFDNQPVEGASKTDYVTSVGFGWSW